MDVQKNMAVALRALKKASGRSMAEFSSELEISRSALQDYLSGKGNPNVVTIAHLAKKLNVDASFLVSGAFSSEQLDVLLKLLDVLKLLAELAPAQRRRFAELLLEMVSLWEEDSSDE